MFRIQIPSPVLKPESESNLNTKCAVLLHDDLTILKQVFVESMLINGKDFLFAYCLLDLKSTNT